MISKTVFLLAQIQVQLPSLTGDFFNSKNIKYEPIAFEKADEVVQAYDSGRCDTYTTDKSGLAAQRTKLSAPGIQSIT